MTPYDSRGMNWDQYCKLTQELFALQQLGNVPEENWRKWVDDLSGFPYFSRSGIPDSRGFDSWQDWAQRVVGIINVDR